MIPHIPIDPQIDPKSSCFPARGEQLLFFGVMKQPEAKSGYIPLLSVKVPGNIPILCRTTHK